ncbi:MAG: histidine kinase dimerization/phospho-acceptor domain-containing protein, partial [Pseudomonadota bacterium]
MNADACALLGHDGTGLHFTAIIRQPGPIAAIEATLADAEHRRSVYAARDVDRDFRHEMEVTPLRKDAAAGVLIVFQDVSDAEGLGQMRRDFVANVSHELRTPLTALLGFIETL